MFNPFDGTVSSGNQYQPLNLDELARLVDERKAQRVVAGIVMREEIFGSIQNQLEIREGVFYHPDSTIPIYSDDQQQEDCCVFECSEGLMSYLDRATNPNGWLLWKCKQILGKDWQNLNSPIPPHVPLDKPPAFTPWQQFPY